MYVEGNDSAFYYLNLAATKGTDSLTKAVSLNLMAAMQADAGDHYGAQESLLQSLALLNKQDKSHHSCLASNYTELGARSNDLHNYQDAIPYFEKALDLTKDSVRRSIILNNLAQSYQKLGRFDQAINTYKAVPIERSKHPTEYARNLSNLAKTKWLKSPEYNAAPEMLMALNIRKAENDEWGLNASFAHLSDFYANNKPDLALSYASKMYRIAKKLGSADDQVEALQKLINLSPNKETKKYFSLYEHLNDSLQTVRNAAKNQFAVVRYESEKSKADNLVLQKENADKKNEIIVKNILLLTAVSSIILGIYLYRKRRKRLLKEKALELKNAIRKSQLKTSRKVHDVVANGLYRIMNEMENQEMDKNVVVDRIEDLYKKSRDISHEDPISDTQAFHTKIADLLKSFATEDIHIAIAGNSAKLWESVIPTVFYEVEHVMQELMVNMKKHSKADKVGVRFQRGQNQIHIYYTDNGVGMPSDTKFTNGLRNTGNRISSIDGVINFDTKRENGLRIQISFPVTK